MVSDRGTPTSATRRYGFLLGASSALVLATRPADGAMLGVGIFAYFLWALLHKRIAWKALLGATMGFLVFGGITLVILRLQLGAWFQTGYALSAALHPEAVLRLSWPQAHELKFGIPISSGSYCWWPAAPALAVAGLIRTLGGRERRVSFVLVTSCLILLTFYSLVEYGRYLDDGLGPRYFLPLVVAMATGGAGLLAPLIARIRFQAIGYDSRIRYAGPGILMAVAAIYGVARVAPLVYPVGRAEYQYATAPLRGAKKMGLKNAIVMIDPGRATAHETNLAQNEPMNPNPDVLFLIRRSEADEACARQHFPGRKWYRAGLTDTLTPY